MLLIELSAVILVAIGLGLVVNPDWGFAALIGGGIFVIANAVFCRPMQQFDVRVYLPKGQQTVGQHP